jgi:hypothetical protein
MQINKEQLSIFIYGAVIFVLSLIYHGAVIFNTQFAIGWDSYFYLVQLKALVEEGAMHSKDSSLVYPILYIIQLFCQDYLLSYQILTLLLFGTLSLLTFLLLSKWTKNHYAALAFTLFSVISPHIFHFGLQFPKNMLGACFLFVFILNIDARKPLIPIFLFILCLFGHRLTFVMAAFYGLGYLFFYVKISKEIIVLSFGGVIVLLGLGFLFGGIINVFDSERFVGVFQSRFSFAPYAFMQLMGNSNLSTSWGIELQCSFVFLFVLPFLFFKKEKQQKLFSLLSLLMVFPFLKWTNDGLAMRMFHMYMLFFPLLLGVLFSKVPKFVGVIFMLTPCVYLGFNSKRMSSTYDVNKLSPPYNEYAQVTSRATTYFKKEKPELIIAHRSLAEYFTFTTGIDAMPWIPEYDIPTGDLWRIVTNVERALLTNYIEESNQSYVVSLSKGYFLIQEGHWQSIIQKLQKNKEIELLKIINSWRNPSKKRPYFLLKNKK